jgi:hypothetical protein
MESVFLASFGGFHHYRHALDLGVVKGMIDQFGVMFRNLKKGIGGVDIDLSDYLSVDTGAFDDLADEVAGGDTVVLADIDEQAGAAVLDVLEEDLSILVSLSRFSAFRSRRDTSPRCSFRRAAAILFVPPKKGSFLFMTLRSFRWSSSSSVRAVSRIFSIFFSWFIKTSHGMCEFNSGHSHREIIVVKKSRRAFS